MPEDTSALAKSITKAASLQSYYTATLMVDRDLVRDAYRAYAYYRWVDDIIDVLASTKSERVAFVKRQRDLMEGCYRNEPLSELAKEEAILVELIKNDRRENSRLQSYIRNMMAIMEFDAHRKSRLIDQEELDWYSDCLGKAVMNALLYFVGNRSTYPASDFQYCAATAAHITHMLRDMVHDTSAGFFNIPREYLQAHQLDPGDFECAAYRSWVQERVNLARRLFQQGKRYIERVENLRCRIVGHWYCARFEIILDVIEHDNYLLKSEYDERTSLSAWMQMVRLLLAVTLRHVTRRRDILL
jgi:phytoene/squalene synthetase